MTVASVTTTRVLRSASRQQLRPVSKTSVAVVETTVTKVTKKVRKTSPKVGAQKAPEPVTYFETLAKKPVPELPESYKKLHDPHFVKGLEFLIEKDPAFHPYIVHSPFPSFKHTVDRRSDKYYFDSLSSGIVSQQISGKAAAAIKQRLIDNLSEDDSFPSAAIIASTPIETLRSCGLSERKAHYVQAIAQDFTTKVLNQARLESASDEEIYDILIQYKGIGPWSVDMFLLFSMKRLDVFTHLDLGVVRGASHYLTERPELLKQVKANTINRITKKKDFKARKWIAIDEEYVSTLSKQFEPYKSCLMLLFWRMSDIQIGALETA